MKKLLLFLIGFALTAGLASCGGIVPDDSGFDETMLYGKWQEGTVYERYYASPVEHILANGDTIQVNGFTWDESDDVSEDEAQPFNWTLTGSTLRIEHAGTFVIVPKLYTITTLNSNELVYNDDYGNEHHYSKVF